MFKLKLQRLARTPLVWFGVFIMLMFWFGIWYQIRGEYEAARNSAHQDLKNLNRVFDEHIVRTVRELDKALIIARKRYLAALESMEHEEAISQRLPDPALLSDLSFQMAAIDHAGVLRATTIGEHPPEPIDLKDREHFVVHKFTREDRTHISKPVLGRRSGRWSVQLTRRIERPDGSFAGVLLASIDPAHFGQFYRSIDLGEEGAILLAGYDGHVRVATGTSHLEMGDYIEKTELMRNARRGDGVYHGDLDGSGRNRIYSVRQVSDKPLFVAVGIAPDIVFASANRNLARYIGVGLIVSVLLIWAILAISRHHMTIAHLARHDDLTGLANRAYFRTKLESAVNEYERHNGVAIFLIDVDNFKSANDTYGHLFGDNILRVLAERMGKCVRKRDLLARLGGDEFAIIAPGLRPSEVEAAAQRLLSLIRKPVMIDGQRVTVTCSIGSARLTDPGATAEELLRNADLALYKAKTDGRNSHRAFRPDMAHGFAEKRKLQEDLRDALENSELCLYYQAIRSIHENRVSGFEALLRWNHPRKGQIAPAIFIPIAEESGLIFEIGEWALNEACRQAVAFEKDKRIAVNLSPVQFRDVHLVEKIERALLESGLEPERLELEITETLMMEATADTLEMIVRIRNLGVRIAMDDFGTGFSSLSCLCSFEFDRIKIDRSFVKGLEENVKYIAIIRAILSLARSLGANTTAEGIETIAQLETVRALGCAEAQGFLFSQPRPIEDMAEYTNPDFQESYPGRLSEAI